MGGGGTRRLAYVPMGGFLGKGGSALGTGGGKDVGGGRAGGGKSIG